MSTSREPRACDVRFWWHVLEGAGYALQSLRGYAAVSMGNVVARRCATLSILRAHAKVTDAHVPALVQKDVLRLEVAVDDAARM